MSGGEAAPAAGGAHTYRGRFAIRYAPRDDGSPDPGEVVWSWVAFEEDDTVGKDRPIVVVGEAPDGRLVALMLSSRDHGGDPRWLSVGTGSWDDERRQSWVRVDRVLAVRAEAVRRMGAALERPVFERIARALGARGSRPGLLRRLLRRLH